TGDVLELLPAAREVRVRQVQSHGVPVDTAEAGQRVALNIVGAAKDEVVRGDWLASPASVQPTTLLDVRVRLLETAPALAHHARIRLYVGADEIIGRIRLLDRPRLGPGETAVAQLRLERPAIVARGARRRAGTGLGGRPAGHRSAGTGVLGERRSDGSGRRASHPRRIPFRRAVAAGDAAGRPEEPCIWGRR